MAVAPRHYGLGPYGLQRYGTYPAALWVAHAATQIQFGLAAKPSRLSVANAATQISFSLAALPTRIRTPLAQAQIAFAVQARPNRILTYAGATQINFAVQGELVMTWRQVDPCETGVWQQQLPPWTQRAA